jgi:hypothetical protein
LCSAQIVALIQGRCAILTGKLGSGFGQLFEADPATDLAA